MNKIHTFLIAYSCLYFHLTLQRTSHVCMRYECMYASGFMSPHTYGGSFSAFLDRLCRRVFRKSSSDSSGTRNSISRSQMQYTRCLQKKKKRVTGVHKHCYSTSCTQIQQHCIIKNLKILNRMSCRHWIRTFLVAFPPLYTAQTAHKAKDTKSMYN